VPEELLRAVGERVFPRLGFSPTDLLWQRLARVVQNQARQAGFDAPEAYLRYLLRAGERELDRLAEALTINETYFFREPKHFDALRQLLPELARGGGPVRILSAGCATGEEAYSLAIAAHRTLGPLGVEFEVLGVDIDRRALERAQEGRYRRWSFREQGLQQAQGYVRQERDSWLVRADIRQRVRFEQMNLVEQVPPGPFHIVFCRNTLMYLTPEHRKTVIGRLVKLLPPGGALFIGSAETLDAPPSELERVTLAGAYLFRRREAAAPAVAPPAHRRGEALRVLLVSRSPVTRVALRQVLQALAGLELAGEARSPGEIAERLRETPADVVLLDAVTDPALAAAGRESWARAIPLLTLARPASGLPRGTGLLVLPDDRAETLRGLGEELARRIRTLAARGSRPAPAGTGPLVWSRRPSWERLLLIGSSTGGPAVVTEILRRLPTGLGLAVLVVQHMPANFTRSFADRLDRLSAYAVREAAAGDLLQADAVYVAPGQHNTTVAHGGRLKVEPPVAGDIYVPNVDRAFLSVVRAGLADRALAVVLTGMGDDGAEGMARLKAAGAYTLAQDPREAVVAGMIEAALARGAVQEVLPADDIPSEVARWAGSGRRAFVGQS
jgi:chemotaxis response regulator CheB/chemotaxis methyl-accepting protein methylase